MTRAVYVEPDEDDQSGGGNGVLLAGGEVSGVCSVLMHSDFAPDANASAARNRLVNAARVRGRDVPPVDHTLVTSLDLDSLIGLACLTDSAASPASDLERMMLARLKQQGTALLRLRASIDAASVVTHKWWPRVESASFVATGSGVGKACTDGRTGVRWHTGRL